MVDNVVDAAVDWSHKAEVGGMRNAETTIGDCRGKRVRHIVGITNAEALYRSLAYSQGIEVDDSQLVVAAEALIVVLACIVAKCEIDLAFLALSQFFARDIHLFHLNVIFVGKVHKCLAIGVVVDFFEKAYRVATFATAEAVTKVFCRRHDKRRSTLVVERTQTLVVCSGTVQTHVVSHNIHNVGGISDLFNCRLVNHSAKYVAYYYAKLQNLLQIRCDMG